MDLVYTSLLRRPAAPPQSAGEVAEVLGILWAHALPEDGLEHISGSHDSSRVDLLMYFLSSDPAATTTHGALQRATALLTRSHEASPVLRRCYLPPQLMPDPPAEGPSPKA
ncbi:hypothetical protein BU198_20755 [Streptomyces sp. CBMA156]|nr:hypothetical protein [Streptomyces sp. CBMA156]